MTHRSDQRKVWFHVDLDGLDAIYAAHNHAWTGTRDGFYESGVDRSLEFFARQKITATYFVIASDLDRAEKRSALERIVRGGHHIASHSLTHPYLNRIADAEKRREIFDSKAKIENDLGVPCHGFRASGYSIDLPSLRLLEEAGYRYDSSIVP